MAVSVVDVVRTVVEDECWLTLLVVLYAQHVGSRRGSCVNEQDVVSVNLDVVADGVEDLPNVVVVVYIVDDVIDVVVDVVVYEVVMS